MLDAQHHLIVAHQVSNSGSDRAQLSKMALAAGESMGRVDLQAIADRGYYSGLELKACEDAGITAYVPKSMTSSANADGRFDKGDFIYVPPATMSTNVPRATGQFIDSPAKRGDCSFDAIGVAPALDVRSKLNVPRAVTDASGVGSMKR